MTMRFIMAVKADKYAEAVVVACRALHWPKEDH
jgi:hypothetical protein